MISVTIIVIYFNNSWTNFINLIYVLFLLMCIEDFIYALVCCLAFLGGVPIILVPDNLKSAIIKANRYEPYVNRALEDFCNHYNMAVIPTRVASPKDKALVENQVKMAYSRIYAKLRNQQFFDLYSLNKGISEKNQNHNQTRMQRKPYWL